MKRHWTSMLGDVKTTGHSVALEVFEMLKEETLPMRHNQETLGNGCICDSGCEQCDALAEAFEAMRRALDNFMHLEPEMREAREALQLADKVSRGR